MDRTEKQDAIAEQFADILRDGADHLDILNVAAKFIAYLLGEIHPDNQAAQVEMAHALNSVVRRYLTDEPDPAPLQ